MSTNDPYDPNPFPPFPPRTPRWAKLILTFWVTVTLVAMGVFVWLDVPF